MAWTDERVDQLKKLWAEGLSASQIAGRMGGVTRNAVIGKVHRLGLSGRATPARPQRGRAPERPRDFSSGLTAGRDTKPVIAEPEFIAPLVLESGDKATVPTLARSMCKWPIGDPTREDFHFCGQHSTAGKPYCAYHARMAFQPPQRRGERREDAHAAPRRKMSGW